MITANKGLGRGSVEVHDGPMRCQPHSHSQIVRQSVSETIVVSKQQRHPSSVSELQSSVNRRYSHDVNVGVHGSLLSTVPYAVQRLSCGDWVSPSKAIVRQTSDGMTSTEEEFVAFEEVKLPSNKAGERFFLKFYLKTKSDKPVLAVTAEDQGDAHYCYRNARTFTQYGVFDSHSRKDVIMWLEKIIHESGMQSRQSTGPERMTIKTAEHPEGVYFVREEQNYSTFPDGRRCTEWSLVDNHNVPHRAVVGEENHARDGHYVYRSVEPFSSIRQLECRNKAGVYHWLEIWIVHEDGLAREKQREQQRRSRPKRRPIVLDVGGSSSRRYKRGNTFRSPIRVKSPSMHPDIIKAQELAREREKLMLEAINFCYYKPNELEIDCMLYWLKILEELKRQWDKGTIYSHLTVESHPNEMLINDVTGFAYLKRNFYGLCLEALREIGTMTISLELLQKSNISKVMRSFVQYPTRDVAAYAGRICEQWTKEVEKHKKTMTRQEMLVDPLDAVGHLLK